MKLNLKKIWTMITNNWLLKLFALLLATVIWLAVVNINDPTKTVTIFNVPIQIVDENIITDKNQTYSVLDSQYVNVTVSGRRSVVKELTASSFSAKASMAELSLANSIPVDVKIINSNIARKVTISSQSINQLAIDIEDVLTKTYNIETKITGQVEKNYEIEEVKLAKNKVDITAPESVHQKINSVIVAIDVNGVTESFTDKYKIDLLDSDGNVIKRNNNITLAKKKAKVTVSLLKLVSVSLQVEVKGELPAECEVSDISTNPESIIISGKPENVEGIDKIIINGDDADLTGVTSDVERNVDLVQYLPVGTKIKGDGMAVLSIKIKQNEITRDIKMSASDIKITDLPTALKGTVLSDSVVVTVKGKKSDVDKITKNSIIVKTVSLSGYTEGKYTVKAEAVVPEGISVVDVDDVKVKISK
ncbi:MAG: hypothetical protein E7254_08510 [Lachnospiraceae bacterium]|nr:hypothetical protein [Lachnospiraceae bacterium]